MIAYSPAMICGGKPNSDKRRRRRRRTVAINVMATGGRQRLAKMIYDNNDSMSIAWRHDNVA
jgi:hypothetical protein